MADVTIETVSFLSEGCMLEGHLFSCGRPAPGVIVCGSWTTVKEQMSGLYARKIAGFGFTALSFDFRNFGKSEGAPRQLESPELKAQDIIAASNWLLQHELVDGRPLGGVGICASAGYMARAIGAGAPISAFATVAAWLHDQHSIAEAFGGTEAVERRKRAGAHAWEVYRDTGEARYVPAFSPTDPHAAMGAMVSPYYGDPNRGAVAEWDNRFAVMSWPDWLDFDGVSVARAVACPTLLIHSEHAVFPSNVRRFARDVGGPCELLWVEGSQLDFYDQPEQIEPSIAAVADHFRTHLGRRELR